MSELKVEKHKWQPNFKDETWITDTSKSDEFTITLKEGADIEIEFTWDYDYGGRGTARTSIPVKLLKELMLELGL